MMQTSAVSLKGETSASSYLCDGWVESLSPTSACQLCFYSCTCVLCEVKGRVRLQKEGEQKSEVLQLLHCHRQRGAIPAALLSGKASEGSTLNLMLHIGEWLTQQYYYHNIVLIVQH